MMTLPAFVLAVLLPVSQGLVSGVVRDASDGQPLPGVIVRLLDGEGQLVAYQMTNSEGFFSFPEDERVAEMHVGLLGYQEQQFLSPFQPSYRIELERAAEKIQEVVIQANKVRMAGDTIQYNIKALKTRDDYVLGDALRRLPGIDVLEDGKVRVDGREVSQLLVDGRNVLDKNYGLAVKHLSVDAVASVEVIRGHQRVRMLRGIMESDEAAINIRLDESARGQANLRGSLSGGYQDAEKKTPFAANASLFWFRDSFSTVDVADYDAEGGAMKSMGDITTSVSGAKYMIDRHFGISPVSAPVGTRGIPFNSTFDSHSVNTVATSESASFGVDLAYYDDWKGSATHAASIYHDVAGGDWQLDRNESRAERQNRLRGRVSYVGNGDKSYIREELVADLARGNGISEISGDVERGLNAGIRQWNATNDLELKLPIGSGRVFGVSSYTQFAGLSEQMTLAGAGPSQMINSSAVWQDLSVLGLSKTKDAWSWSLQPGFRWRRCAWTGDLSGVPDEAVPGKKQGAVVSSGWSAGLSWSLIWRKKKLLVEASGRFHYDRVRSGDYKAGTFFPDASARINYESGRWEFDVRVGAALPFPDIQALGEIRMLTDYDRIRYGCATATFLPQTYYSAMVLFREPVSGWNARMQTRFAVSRSRISGRDILDQYIVQFISEETMPVRTLNSAMELSKGFYSFNGKVTASLSHALTASGFTQNGITTDYQSRSLAATLDVNLSPVSFWSCVLTVSGSWSTLSSARIAPSESLSYSIRFRNNFYISRKFSLGAQVDVYSNPAIGTLHVFPDLSAEWRAGRNVRIKLMANNLLNVKEYAYTAISPLQDNAYVCRIHPLTILLGVSYAP